MLLGSALVLAGTAPVAAQDRAFADATRYVHDKVTSCWNVPAAVPAGRTVRIRFELDRDGALISEPTMLDQPSKAGSALLAESAKRAVIRCAPYDGLKRYGALYSRWREIVLNFRQPD
ncbi:TonB C-terminal domain-containing protein [Bosea sp. LjRoot90]|uniref:hypothetical protein n=1 Tax=Bosea sp. LjRoot90 TaxID=3342342 RepID=UPI003ED10A88